jgi:hypothetical protein
MPEVLPQASPPRVTGENYRLICAVAGSKPGFTFCGNRSENSHRMKKYMLCLIGSFVAMAFIASCQQQGTTGNVIYESTGPGTDSPAYMNRPAPSPSQ